MRCSEVHKQKPVVILADQYDSIFIKTYGNICIGKKIIQHDNVAYA